MMMFGVGAFLFVLNKITNINVDLIFEETLPFEVNYKYKYLYFYFKLINDRKKTLKSKPKRFVHQKS